MTWWSGGAPDSVWSSVVWASLTPGNVVPPYECAVNRRADALICLCAGDDESPDAETRQHGLEDGVLEGVGVALLDERLGIARSKRGRSASPRSPLELLVVMLDPDDGHPF